MTARSEKKRIYRFQPGSIGRLHRRFRSHIAKHAKTLVGAAVCMLGAAAMEVMRPWPIKVIFDGVLIPQESPGALIEWLRAVTGGEDLLLAAMALSILVIAVVGGMFAFGQAFLISSVGQKVVASIRQVLYGHIQLLSQSFHDERSTGDLLARLTGDVRMMRDLLVNAVVYISARALVLVGTVTIMAFMNWRLTLVALAILPILVVVVFKFGAKIKGAARRQRRKEGMIAQVMAENISAIKVVQAYAREAHENERFATQNNASTKAGLVATRLEANLDRLVQVILAVGTAAVIWYGVKLARANLLTPGDLLVFVAYLTSLYKPVRKLASLAGRISKATVCGERILSILELEPEIQDAPGAIEAPVFRGEIVFDNVAFSYGSSDHVLRGASTRIAPGEIVAFVSDSGSGKSTIANLILRFYDPKSGSITIDGIDLRRLKVTSLRERIAILLQESVLFKASIRENIAYGKLDATDEEIAAAVKAANADEFIDQLPEGLETVVGERGATLSGGQRQRIAIARAIVRDAPILILDEPMVGLDRRNEDVVRSALQRLMRGRTCLVISHNPATANIADRVLTIRDGKLYEKAMSPDDIVLSQAVAAK